MSSSRALAFVGIAPTVFEAEALAQRALGSVKGNVYSREDIGTAGLIQRRIETMRRLRG